MSQTFNKRSQKLLRAYFNEYVGGPFPGENTALIAILSRMDDFVQGYNEEAYGHKDVPVLTVNADKIV
jgi:hypothetical protein